MRGGTSKGVFYHERDLPVDRELRDRFLLAAMGSPDPFRRQVDGLGGAASTTSKIAVIGDGTPFGVDVTYDFGQVSIDKPHIDRRGNCGNISSAVGPFAVDEGLVTGTDPFTTVKILNLNTNKIIVAHVPTRDGKFDPIGDMVLPGVPGTGSSIQLDFIDPTGAVTGKLLPTGNVVDDLAVPGFGTIPISMVDAANPLVFVRWEDVGLRGLELPSFVDADEALLRRLESIRAFASVLSGISGDIESATRDTPSVPKLALIGAPRDYRASNGADIAKLSTNVRAAMMSMGRMHNSYPLTGAIATAVAATLPGTLVHDVATVTSDSFTIGHPAGLLSMLVDIDEVSSGWRVNYVAAFRTSRRLMEGHVLVPDHHLSA
jgi:hypothetical protein